MSIKGFHISIEGYDVAVDITIIANDVSRIKTFDVADADKRLVERARSSFSDHFSKTHRDNYEDFDDKDAVNAQADVKFVVTFEGACTWNGSRATATVLAVLDCKKRYLYIKAINTETIECSWYYAPHNAQLISIPSIT